MKSSQETIARKVLRPGVDTGLFFLLIYLYVWLAIDPRLVHQSIGILTPYYWFSYHTGWPFFFEHLNRSGGLVEYCTRLFSQFYAIGWAGALIITVAMWAAALFADNLSRRAGRPRGNVLRYVPAAIVLEMYGGYSHPLSGVLSLLAALGGYVLYVRLAPRAAIKRLPWLLLACPILYWMAGSGSLLFPIMVAVDELLIGGRKLLAAAALVCVGVVPWTAGMLFGLDAKQAYGGFLVWVPGVALGKWPLTLALYAFFPTVLAGTALWGAARARDVFPLPEGHARPRDLSPSRGFAPGPPKRRRGKGESSPGRKSRHFSLGGLPVRAIAIAALFSGVAAAIWCSLDSFTRTMLRIDYEFQHGRWTEVLSSAERLPQGTYSFRCHRNIMLALYHSGRLADEMFHYPQGSGLGLLNTPDDQRDIGSYYQESRLFLDLGLVNHAERCAYESLATSGDQPEVVETLATINIVKGRPETARVFLNALAIHPFHRRAARDTLRRLEADPTLESDPRVSQMRQNMIDKDRIGLLASEEDALLLLLERNPHNKMAFELLMAFYLSAGRPDRVVASFPRLKDFSYPRVPRHYQEAWLICSGSPEGPPPAPGFELDPEVLRRAGEMRRITAASARPQDAAVSAWEAGLGDSYFFYFAAGLWRR